MEIRPASPNDFARVREIYAAARAYMKEKGNPEQWGDRYPEDELIREDIQNENLYLCAEGEEILGVFFYAEGADPTYQRIYDGKWLNEESYGVIHRIAVAEHQRGVASFCFDYAFSRCKNLKIDTHRDNLPMQRSLEKNGFFYCGIIHLENGDERVAYQKGTLGTL